MCEGNNDFDVYCSLWSRSTPPSDKGASRTKTPRLYDMPDPAKFDITFPRSVQDAYTDLSAKIQKLVEERRRTAVEAERQAAIELKKKEALAEAARQLETEKQAALATAAASAAVDEHRADQNHTLH